MMDRAPLDHELAQAPADGTAYWVHTDDGVRLRVGLWRGSDPQKGTILFFTGRTEYIEKYGRTVSDFLKFGYTALVIEWRGQGLSDRITKNRRTGHVTDFLDYQKDVAAMIRAAKELDLPKAWYLFGNSMGGCIGLRALLEGLPIVASAFSAPMWNIVLSPAQRLVARPVSWIFQTIGKGHIYTPGRKDQIYALSVPFHDNCLTSDPEMYQFYIDQAMSLPDAQLGAPSMAWLYQCLQECRNLSGLPSPRVPCLAFLGGQDSIVDAGAIEDRMACWPGGRLERVENGKHDLLSEKPDIREWLTRETCRFFSDQMATYSKTTLGPVDIPRTSPARDGFCR